MGYDPNAYLYALDPLQAAQALQRQSYPGSQAGNMALPQSIRDQYAGAQQLQQAATSTAPHSSGLVSGLQGLAGYLGGRQEAQADAAAVPYQGQGGAPSSGVQAALAKALGRSDDPSAPMQLAGAAPGTDPGQDASSGGLPGMIGRKSDRRLKSDVSRIGTLPNGLAVYRYRLEGGAFEVGLMADEVALLHPDAVWIHPDDGFMRVNYELAVL